MQPGTEMITRPIPPQAFRPYVVDLMEPKDFPDRRQYPGGPPIPPYDMTGYELRFQMGLDVVNVDEPFAMPSGEWGVVSTEIGAVTGGGSAVEIQGATSLYSARRDRSYSKSDPFRTPRRKTSAPISRARS